MAAVRRELSRLQSDYLELGLRASLLAGERNTALKNLQRTQDYLAAVQPGLELSGRPGRRDRDAVPTAAAAAAPPESGVAAQPRSTAAISRPPRWRRAVDAVGRHTLAAKQLVLELSDLRRELADLRNDYSTLEQYADGLIRQRDAAREDLHMASRRCVPVAAVSRAPERPRDTPAVDPAQQLKSVEDTLKRVQVEKNDIEIRLAERDAALAQLQSEREAALLELDGLNERLSSAEQKLASTRDSNAALVSRLASLGNEFDQAKNRAAEQLAALQQRIERIEPALAQARREREDLETSLQAAKARYVYVEQQRQRLKNEQEEQHGRLANSELQLGELRAQEEHYRSRTAELDQQLASAAQERAALAEKNHALVEDLEAERARHDERQQQLAALQQRHDHLREQADALGESLALAEQRQAAVSQDHQSMVSALETLNADFAAKKMQDQERIDWLEQRFGELEPVLERAHRDREALELSLQEARARRADSDRQRQRLTRELDEQRAKLTERELQLVEVQAQKQQLYVELEALGQTLKEVEQQRTDVGEENRVSADKLNAVLGEYAATRKKDRERIAALEQQLVESAAQLSAAHQQIDTLKSSLSAADQRAEVADQRVQTLELQLKDRQAQDSVPPPAVVQKQAPPAAVARHHRHFSWTKAAAGFIFLLGVLVSGTKLWDVYHQDGERLGLSTGIASNETSLAEKSIASLERAADSASPANTAERSLSEQQAVVAPDAGEPAAGTSASDEKPERLPFLQNILPRPGDAGGTHVHAYLMQRDASGKGSAEACGKGGEGGGPCPQADQKISGDAVIELPSGVKYSVIRNGTGRAPAPGDRVVISYRATLPDGTRLDSSTQQDGAEAFQLSDAIPGLQDVLQYMEEGAQWEVYVPAALAFRKPGPFGGRDVIFNIELRAVGGPDVVAGRGGYAGEDFSTPRETAAAAGDAEPVEPRGDEAQLAPHTRAAAQDYLRENASKADVVSLPSGLQYKVLKRGDGSGRTPQATDTVTVRYRGRLPDGREFDSSDSRGGQVELLISEVIPGWREALLNMAEGDQWELYVPPALAVPRGTVRKRSAFGLQPLIYDIELVTIQ